MSFIVKKNTGLENEENLAQPGLYEVYLHNDDFTPMGLVIKALRMFFHMDIIKAENVALEAHTKGRAVCGVFSRDIAETRIDQAGEYARVHEHPLKWSMEAR